MKPHFSGTLGLKLMHQNDPQDHILDAVQIVGQALAAAYAEKPLAPPPKTCSNTALPWTDGPIFYQ